MFTLPVNGRSVNGFLIYEFADKLDHKYVKPFKIRLLIIILRSYCIRNKHFSYVQVSKKRFVSESKSHRSRKMVMYDVFVVMDELL